MKRLVITYAGATLFDDDVADFTWNESDEGVQVAGKYKRGSLIEKLQEVSARNTENQRAALRAGKRDARIELDNGAACDD